MIRDLKKYQDSFIDKKYNRLTILELVGTNKGKCMAKTICECGTIKEIVLSAIIRGKSKSCGCILREVNTLHGRSKHPLYRLLFAMKSRCYNKKSNRYKDYGAKGVVICDEWRNNFKAFYDWAISNGWEEGLQIDKHILAHEIPGKMYSPDFCCFVTNKVNSRLTTRSRIIEYNGESMCVADWADKLGVHNRTLRSRFNIGWTVEEAFTTPFNQKNYVNK